jgi:uridine phosphorylase
MAQDPEREEEQAGGEIPLTTHALDMVTLWASDAGTVTAEMEADNIRGVLESNGIPVMVVGASQFANLGFEVKVPRGRVKEAEELIEQAEAAGPDAAIEGEAESEK